MYGYDREKAVAYAHKWAYGRNPAYGDFSEMGGDCTNFRFITTNTKAGPYGWPAELSQLQIGDVMQLSFDKGVSFGHTALIVSVGTHPDPDNVLVATHSEDADNRPVSHWFYALPRFLHIEGAR